MTFYYAAKWKGKQSDMSFVTFKEMRIVRESAVEAKKNHFGLYEKFFSPFGLRIATSNKHIYE